MNPRMYLGVCDQEISPLHPDGNALSGFRSKGMGTHLSPVSYSRRFLSPMRNNRDRLDEVELIFSFRHHLVYEYFLKSCFIL